MKRGTFYKKIQPMDIFSDHKWRKYCGTFTDIVALKSNESYCNSSLGQGEKKEARGEAPEYCRDYFISILRKTSF